jgi:hypothetical protein
MAAEMGALASWGRLAAAGKLSRAAWDRAGIGRIKPNTRNNAKNPLLMKRNRLILVCTIETSPIRKTKQHSYYMFFEIKYKWAIVFFR